MHSMTLFSSMFVFCIPSYFVFILSSVLLLLLLSFVHSLLLLHSTQIIQREYLAISVLISGDRSWSSGFGGFTTRHTIPQKHSRSFLGTL